MAETLAVAPTEVMDPQKELARLCLRGYGQQVGALLATAPGEAAAAGALDSAGRSPLHLSVLGGHLELTKALATWGCDASLRDAEGCTALHLAASEDRVDLVRALLAARCDADAADADGQTALHRAVMVDCDLQVLDALLEDGGANPAQADARGATPLLLAAEYGRPEHLRRLLTRREGLIGAANEHGWTALHLAAHGRELRRNTVRPGKFGLAVQALLEAGATVDARDEDGQTALHRGAAAGNAKTVQALLNGRADAAAADACRWTPLHYAAQAGHVEVARLLLEARAAAQPSHAPSCLTPLALATTENQVRIAELLVNHRADPNLRGPGLASPFMLARKDPERLSDILGLFQLGFVKHAD